MAKNLTAFLAQNAKKIDNVTFIASDRFVDPDTGEAISQLTTALAVPALL